MATGLTDDKNQLFFDPDSDEFWKKCKAWSSMKPKKSVLRDEILRRQKAYTGEGECKIPHTQKSKADYETWLKENTQISPANLQFVVSYFKRFAKNVMDAAGPSDNDAEKYMNFRGVVWILRMIHCLVENDDARIAFSKIYDSLDRSELDGKKNPETARVSGWQVIADHFNDPNFNPRSTAYPLLHKSFKASICLSHAEVVKHGPIDATKVKDKFSEMRSKLAIIKTNHDASGQGEGSLTNDEIAAGSEEGTLPSVGNFDDRANFIGTESPTLLYMWEKSIEYDLFGNLMQKISDNVALGVDPHAICNSGRKKKRKSPSSADTEELTRGLNASTRAFNEFNLANSVRDQRDVKNEMMQTQREIMQTQDCIDNLTDVVGKEAQLERQVNYLKVLIDDLEDKQRVLDAYKRHSVGCTEQEI